MYRQIMVCVDGSAISNKALVAATDMAREANGRSRLRLIHVLDEMAYFTGFDPYGGQSGELIKIMRETGERVLADALAIAQAAGIEADTLLIDKFGERLGETIADEARHWKADLIVVGTHGRRRVGRMFLGSGAEQIIRLAPVPVLVIRSSESEAAPAVEA
jgi:nucleotide-binding universal stress UspA family protein